MGLFMKFIKHKTVLQMEKTSFTKKQISTNGAWKQEIVTKQA